MKKIELTKGMVAIVDDDLCEFLSQWKWHCSYYGYAERRCMITKKIVKMHRQIMGLSDGDPDIDHEDGNKLNNLRSNLRVCSKLQNNKNMVKRSGEYTSKYKGVYFSTGRKRPWRSQLKVNGKAMYLGCFASEIEAAKAYNDAALTYHKEYAKLNDLED